MVEETTQTHERTGAQQAQDWTLESSESEIPGETRINEEVIASVAAMAARETDGVSELGQSTITGRLARGIGAGGNQRTRGVGIEAGKREAIVDLTVRVNYGYNIPEVVRNVRRNVAESLMSICGLTAKEINIDVAGIDFPQRTAARVQ